MNMNMRCKWVNCFDMISWEVPHSKIVAEFERQFMRRGVTAVGKGPIGFVLACHRDGIEKMGCDLTQRLSFW